MAPTSARNFQQSLRLQPGKLQQGRRLELHLPNKFQQRLTVTTILHLPGKHQQSLRLQLHIPGKIQQGLRLLTKICQVNSSKTLLQLHQPGKHQQVLGQQLHCQVNSSRTSQCNLAEPLAATTSAIQSSSTVSGLQLSMPV
jgi:hypothetical protein